MLSCGHDTDGAAHRGAGVEPLQPHTEHPEWLSYFNWPAGDDDDDGMSELNLDAYDEETAAAEVDPAKVKDLTEIQTCIDSIVSKLERGKVRNEEDELEIADWAVYFYGLSWSCRTETIAALAVFCALHKKVRVMCSAHLTLVGCAPSDGLRPASVGCRRVGGGG